jgi:hypothetical protein
MNLIHSFFVNKLKIENTFPKEAPQYFRSFITTYSTTWIFGRGVLRQKP